MPFFTQKQNENFKICEDAFFTQKQNEKLTYGLMFWLYVDTE